MTCRRAIFLIVLICSAFSRAEEGFWPFDMVPKAAIERRYEFMPSDEWLEHARLGSLRVSAGGSASFVSPHGLVMTNRHVVGSALQRLSVPGKTDLIRDGFLAETPADELNSTGLVLEQLLEMENVNATVRDVMTRFECSDDVALRALRVEAEKAETRERIKIQAVKLYPDGEYRLFKFKMFNDVRLVFAADLSSGYFGGDPDNFNFPRYDFDVAFVRVYENGKPVESPEYFPWSHSGAKENELIFFAGNPMATERSITLAHLELKRNAILPTEIALYSRQAAALRRFAERAPENAQFVQDKRHQIENELKRLHGQLDGLQGPVVMGRKNAEEEDALRSIGDAERTKSYAAALAEMRRAVENFSSDQIEFQLLSNPWGLGSAQWGAALSIAGMEESGTYYFRAAEAREARFETFYYYDPLHRLDSERTQLKESFELIRSRLGPEHPLVKMVLEGKSPAERAAELLAGTKLGQSEFYRSALTSGFEGIEKSGDPLLILAKKVLRRMRVLIQRQQREFADVEKKVYPQMARALGLSSSSRRPPDGSFTPRLSFGTVQGYEANGHALEPFTRCGALFRLCDEAGNREPHHLNDRWLQARSKLDPCMPFNFVTDADGYGGNSGSPVFNRNREIVGILFDGNYPGLVGKFMYDERTKRSVCVDSRAIVNVMERVYDAKELVKEFAP